MGVAVDTIAFSAVNPGVAGAIATPATGDTNRIREFATTSKAGLHQVIRKAATAGFVQIVTPVFHDAVRGIRFTTAETPSRFLSPRETFEPVMPGDTLAITISGGSAETDLVVLGIYYNDLLGVTARLFSWSDIVGKIEHIKPVQVAVTTSASIGTWQDTILNVTEDLLKADRKYAVLGYVTDVALGAVALKGSELGNLRVGGPGLPFSDLTSNFFVDESVRHNMPYIPVISANNRSAIFVSTVNDLASTAANVQIILGLLPPSFQ